MVFNTVLDQAENIKGKEEKSLCGCVLKSSTWKRYGDFVSENDRNTFWAVCFWSRIQQERKVLSILSSIQIQPVFGGLGLKKEKKTKEGRVR